MPKRRKQNLNGKGFFDVVKKIGGFLKDTKILSTVGSTGFSNQFRTPLADPYGSDFLLPPYRMKG